MATLDLRSHVQEVLHSARAKAAETSAQIGELESLMSGLEERFDAFRDALQAETASRLAAIRALVSRFQQSSLDFDQAATPLHQDIDRLTERVVYYADALKVQHERSLADGEHFNAALAQTDSELGTRFEDFHQRLEMLSTQIGADIAGLTPVAEQTARSVEHDFVDSVSAMSQAVGDAASALSVSAGAELDARREALQGYERQLDTQHSSLDESLTRMDQAAETRTAEMLESLQEALLGKLGELADDVMALKAAYDAVTDKVKTSARAATDTVDTANEAVTTVSVGLRYVFDTVKNAKEIIDELSL